MNYYRFGFRIVGVGFIGMAGVPKAMVQAYVELKVLGLVRAGITTP